MQYHWNFKKLKIVDLRVPGLKLRSVLSLFHFRQLQSTKAWSPAQGANSLAARRLRPNPLGIK